jgi:hypothetical protein
MGILRNLYQTHSKPPECKIINDKVVKFSDMVVYQFRMGDVEDPVLYAADPVSQWQQTEAGKFVMANAVEPIWWIQRWDHLWHGFEFVVVARMKESDQTFYTLKYVGTKD